MKNQYISFVLPFKFKSKGKSTYLIGAKLLHSSAWENTPIRPPARLSQWVRWIAMDIGFFFIRGPQKLSLAITF